VKGIVGLVGLLLSLVIVGILVKKQLTSTHQILPVPQVPLASGSPSLTSAPATPVAEQSKQVQQQFKRAVDDALQQPRAVPEEK
jgi:hypothetical protein